MIVVHQLPGADRLPSLTPQAIAVRTYLHMAGLPHRVETLDPSKVPMGNAPFLVESVGRVCTDPVLFIDDAEVTTEAPVDGWLSEGQRQSARWLKRGLSEGLVWIIAHERWTDRGLAKDMMSAVHTGLPEASRWSLRKVKSRARQALQVHGVGRMTNDQVFAQGKRDLKSLSAVLAAREFVLGDHPSTADAIAYGLVESLLSSPFDTPLKAFAQGLGNLPSYARRMRGRYWEDTETDRGS